MPACTGPPAPYRPPTACILSAIYYRKLTRREEFRNFFWLGEKALPEQHSTRYTMRLRRGVAQPGRALSSGGRGRRFKSSHPDQVSKPKSQPSGWLFSYLAQYVTGAPETSSLLQTTAVLCCFFATKRLCAHAVPILCPNHPFQKLKSIEKWPLPPARAQTRQSAVSESVFPIPVQD